MNTATTHQQYEQQSRLAKQYAEVHGYRMDGGGWIYDKDGNRVLQGWRAFYRAFTAQIQEWYVTRGCITRG